MRSQLRADRGERAEEREVRILCQGMREVRGLEFKIVEAFVSQAQAGEEHLAGAGVSTPQGALLGRVRNFV